MAIDTNAKLFLNAFYVLDGHERETQERQRQRALAYNAANPGSSSESIGHESDRHVMGVDFVCLAFSVELYLKAVFEVLGESQRGHNIRALFEKLPENTQLELFELHRQGAYGETLETYKSQMDVISNGFEQFRYSYEHKSLSYHRGFALQMVQAMQKFIDNKRRAKPV